MYRILLGNYPIYDLRDKNYIVENPQLDLEVNKVGSVKFKIRPEHPYFDNINKLSSVLSVLKGNTTIFKGRVISDEQGLYNDKNIECEGVLCYLNDSIVRPYTFNGTPAQHFTALLTSHNNQVTDEQKLLVGTITVTDPNNYITRSSENYESTWDVLNGDLISKLGGYLKVRYENEGTYVDYLADFSDTSTQVIELGENLLDVLVKNNAADVYTAVIPLGAEVENENGETERLTIKSVNNDSDFIINTNAYNQYGLIFAPIKNTTWKDVTIASNLLTKGTNYLNNEAVMLKSSLEVSAIDLNVTDEDIESFFIYEYVRFVSSVHNINQTYLLNKISIPLAHPESMSITLGREENSLTGIQMGNKKDLDTAIERVNIVEKNYEINTEKVNEELDEVRQEIQTNMTSIMQDNEQIIMTALQDYVTTGDLTTFQNTVSTQFQQMADSFEFNFTNITSQISNLDGTTQQQFQEIVKYIRFIDGTINLGEVGNPIILKIEHDEVAFYQNNNKVAYLSNSKMMITDAEITNSLTIGNFAWKPRTNGNLSLVYTGGETSGN